MDLSSSNVSCFEEARADSMQPCPEAEDRVLLLYAKPAAETL